MEENQILETEEVLDLGIEMDALIEEVENIEEIEKTEKDAEEVEE